MAAVVIGIVGFALVALGFLALRWVGGKAEDAVGTSACPFLDDDAASAVLGDGSTAEQLGSLLQNTLGVVLDSRALADADSCFVTGPTVGSARVAKAGGGRDRYAAEREQADPQTEDRGGGLSVTREGWYGSEVDDLGDEAFCTTSDFTGAVGVLVRDGDTLVFASIQPLEFDQSQLEVDGSTGAVTNPALCERSQQLARAVLAG